MTREEAKCFWPIIKAYSEGKTIEYLLSDGKWANITEDFLFDNSHERYRIKQESKYRPFTSKEECWQEMLKHQPFGWVILKGGKHPDSKAFIIKLTENCFYCIGDGGSATYNLYDYEFEKHFWLFADGTPFGIKEE